MNRKAIPKVLVLGCDASLFRSWQRLLREKIELVDAPMEAVPGLLSAQPAIAAIVIGDFERKPVDESFEVAKRIRPDYRGKLVTTAEFGRDGQKLRESGCDHAVNAVDLPGRLPHILQFA